MTTPQPSGEELHELLQPYAVEDGNGAMPVEGNHLLDFWNAAPEHAARMLQQSTSLRTGNSLGARLTELVRLTVANRTGCPV